MNQIILNRLDFTRIKRWIDKHPRWIYGTQNSPPGIDFHVSSGAVVLPVCIPWQTLWCCTGTYQSECHIRSRLLPDTLSQRRYRSEQGSMYRCDHQGLQDAGNRSPAKGTWGYETEFRELSASLGIIRAGQKYWSPQGSQPDEILFQTWDCIAGYWKSGWLQSRRHCMLGSWRGNCPYRPGSEPKIRGWEKVPGGSQHRSRTGTCRLPFSVPDYRTLLLWNNNPGMRFSPLKQVPPYTCLIPQNLFFSQLRNSGNWKESKRYLKRSTLHLKYFTKVRHPVKFMIPEITVRV